MLAYLKSQLRPRLAFAVFTGIGFAMLQAVMPPTATLTVRLPTPLNKKQGEAMPFDLVAISSNARYLVTYGRHHDSNDRPTLHLWDRTRGLEQSILATDRADEFDSFRALFSPDESKVAVAAFHWDVRTMNSKPRIISLYDLESATLLHQWETRLGQEFFAPNGRLFSVSEDTLSEFETGEVVRRLPKLAGDFQLHESIGRFAIYRKDQHVRVHSWLTGECEAEHDLINATMSIRGMSNNGQVVCAEGCDLGATPWSLNFLGLVTGAAGKEFESTTNKAAALRNRTLSPDGRYLVQTEERKRPGWLPTWIPFDESWEVVRVTHWTTARSLAEFKNPSVRTVLFSPQTNQFVMFHNDARIDMYAFPFQTPWGSIARTACLAAAGVWTVAWIWAYWRKSRKVIASGRLTG